MTKNMWNWSWTSARSLARTKEGNFMRRGWVWQESSGNGMAWKSIYKGLALNPLKRSMQWLISWLLNNRICSKKRPKNQLIPIRREEKMTKKLQRKMTGKKRNNNQNSSTKPNPSSPTYKSIYFSNKKWTPPHILGNMHMRNIPTSTPWMYTTTGARNISSALPGTGRLCWP